MKLHRIRAGAALVAATLIVGACTNGTTSETTVTTAPVSVPTTSGDPAVSETTPTTAPPTTSANAAVDTVDCADAPDNSILCEAYELIQRHYVDEIDPAILAEGANEGVTAGPLPTATDGDGQACIIPTDDFVTMCSSIEAGNLDQQTSAEAAVNGMVLAALDANSSYFDEQALDLIEEEQSGSIEGIGALVSSQEEGADQPNTCQLISDTCRVEIVSTIDGGPARAAELQEGDVFLRVDGESVEGLTIDELTARVRGPAGTDVELTFLRDDEEVDVTITRAAIQVPVILSEMVGDVAYIRLNIFTENADEQLHAALETALANDPSALVFDLRNNPGGLLDTSVNIASEFLTSGVVVTTESPESTQTYEVEPGGLATDPSLPVYLLVNAGSASASEVVAGALSDEGRATIIGDNTFGKNTVQQRFALSNGGALKLTIARWLTPAGRDFGGDGITPDIEADLPDELTPAEVVAAALASVG